MSRMPEVVEFHLAVEGEDERQVVTARVHGKQELLVATPPEFPGGTPGIWSPEDLLLGAVATCFGVTLAAVAKHRGVPLYRTLIDATGVVGKPPDGGGYRFTSIELAVEIATDPEQARAAVHTVGVAEKACLVTRSLDTPVTVALRVIAGDAVPA